MNAKDEDIQHAIDVVVSGGVIAYPTEAVYGIGCDPFNESAVARIADIKNRSLQKGLIVIASQWSQVAYLVKPLNSVVKARVFPTWPGAITWIFPAAATVPSWVSGKHDSIAIRISKHPIVKSLCDGLNAPIISTSANRSGQAPMRQLDQVKAIFSQEIDYYLGGELGGLNNPSQIRDAMTGAQIRP